MTEQTAEGQHVAAQAQAEHYDPEAHRIGMWLFLFTEALIFGTMFIAYAVYLTRYRMEFSTCSAELNRLLGAANTVILLTSSLTMALSIAAIERAKKRLCLGLLGVTVVLSLGFMVIKGYEWHHKFEHGIAPQAPELMARPGGEQIFYGLYFTMTGFHAAHVIIGALVILGAAYLVAKGRVNQERHTFIVNTGLYWHLVDLVWIFLFPLFYLIH
jgi:cytochrome c oxidase subunit 3